MHDPKTELNLIIHLNTRQYKQRVNAKGYKLKITAKRESIQNTQKQKGRDVIDTTQQRPADENMEHRQTSTDRQRVTIMMYCQCGVGVRRA